MSAPPVRIALLGSCVTQESLRASGLRLRALAANYARVSLASLSASMPGCRIVLHRFRWAARMQGAATLPAEIATLPGQPAVRAADHDALLRRLQDRFLAVLPQTQVLEAVPDLCVADPKHPWGLDPLHFIPAYHAAVAQA